MDTFGYDTLPVNQKKKINSYYSQGRKMKNRKQRKLICSIIETETEYYVLAHKSCNRHFEWKTSWTTHDTK